MSQPIFYVSKADVMRLVEDFLNSRTMHCSSFQPAEMVKAFNLIPITARATFENHFYATSLCKVSDVQKVLNVFTCCKLTSFCNSWTGWMQNRINEQKIGLLPENCTNG